MKKILTAISVALLVTGCARDDQWQEESKPAGNGNFTLIVGMADASASRSAQGNEDFVAAPWLGEDADDPQSRTSFMNGITSFQAGDAIGINRLIVNDGTKMPENHRFVTEGEKSGAPAIFTLASDGAGLLAGGTYDAYYPYEDPDPRLSDGAIYFSQRYTQTQSADGDAGHLADLDRLHGVAVMPIDSKPSSFLFEHVMALLEFHVTLSGVDASDLPELRRIAILCEDSALPFCNGIKANRVIYGVDNNNNRGPIVLKANHAFTSTADTYTGWMTIVPNPHGGNQTIKVKVYTSKGVVSREKKIPADGFKRGVRYITNFDFDMTLASLSWDALFVAPPSSQINTAARKIVVRNAEELAWIAAVSNGDALDLPEGLTSSFEGWTIEMGASIDLSRCPWTPISTFKGVFDGRNDLGYKISELNINGGSLQDQGFISQLYGTIRNTTIASGSVTGYQTIGSFVGKMLNLNGLIEGCINEGCVVFATASSLGMAGGISGGGSGIIRGCVNRVQVNARLGGGIAGPMNTPQMIACLNLGNVSYGISYKSSDASYVVASINGGETSYNKINKDFCDNCFYYKTGSTGSPASSTGFAAGPDPLKPALPGSPEVQGFGITSADIASMNATIENSYSDKAGGWRWSTTLRNDLGYPVAVKQ